MTILLHITQPSHFPNSNNPQSSNRTGFGAATAVADDQPISSNRGRSNSTHAQVVLRPESGHPTPGRQGSPAPDVGPCFSWYSGPVPTIANLPNTSGSAWCSDGTQRLGILVEVSERPGLDVQTFDDLLERFLARWNYLTIDRADVNPFGKPQVARQSLDAAGTLGLVLHWICLTMLSYTLQHLFGVTPAVCSRYLASGMHHLLAVLREHPLAKFDGQQQNDGHNCILAFAPDGTIIMYSILNAPGSWHDATIAEPLYKQLLDRTPPGYQIISNTAFPRKSERIQACILAPASKRGDRLPHESVEFARLQLLNEQLVLAQQAAEWGM
ncbi:uncharacterized protein PGTG_14308 [Puccinia graminis f. sp. tritici CRL 75-36-700-3]|uniref:DDE Tnp4 domain-containing protein n=1 Tax=Puccinia graminis f. sp. tritici (strain CRL 75-36-700-3 / race SCCL) TaxID=418459 RepID=E3KVC9_PUCGT|nr:uncharacterized protein PGTG_14308 [Puccinia graminis f. sp. tritici CRL 75-36-700-3]EFP88224.2 hypothetical protein PGTG_14308 [Puccinia graminis f. sp. tritici CRL 75-36-700-3]